MESIIALGLGLLFEGSVWVVAFREIRKTKGDRGWLEAARASKDPTVFMVLFEDTTAMLGLLTALVGVALAENLNMPVLDGLASIVIGIFWPLRRRSLAYECQSLLTGESAAPEVRADIRRIAGSQVGVAHLNEAITMHFGPQDILVVLSLDFEDDLPSASVEGAVTQIEWAIKRTHPEVTRVFVEAQSVAAHKRMLAMACAEETNPEPNSAKA